jgi:hypothetical protein
MTTTAFLLSIVALLITGFAVWLQFAMYNASNRALSDFRAEVHNLVGELRGATGRLLGAQEHQFDRMLEAFVERPQQAERAGEQSRAAAQSVDSAVEQLRELKIHGSGQDRPDGDARLDRVVRELQAARESASDAAANYEDLARRVGRGMSHVSVTGVGRFPVDTVQIMENVRRLRDGDGYASLEAALDGVIGPHPEPRDAFRRGIQDWLFDDSTAGRVRLTPRAEEFLKALDAERKWRAEHPGQIP